MKSLFLLFFLSTQAFASFIGGGVTANSCTASEFASGIAANGALTCSVPAGGGNFEGPGSSTAHNLVGFGDTSGTLGEDSGVAASNLCLLTGNQTVAGIKTLSSAPVLSALTASLPVCTSAGKAASSTCAGLIPWADIATGNNYRLIATGAAGVTAEAAAITAARLLVSDANGIPTASSVTTTTVGYLDPTSSVQTQLNAKLPTTGVGLVDAHRGFFAGTALTDQCYTIDEAAPYAYTINTLKVESTAGTATWAVKINGTSVTGISAVSVSSTPATGTASAANSVSINDKITICSTSTSSAANVGWTLKYTR